MSCSQDIFQLRKEHKLKDALAKARECYATDSNDIWVQRAYGWVLYDLIKQEMDAFEAKERSPGDLAKRLHRFLGEYWQFGENVRPDLLHSMLLTQVLKGSRVWNGFLDFARWWGVEYFRDEDKEPYTPPQGREIPSLATRYVYAVGREASNRFTEIEPDLLDWAEAQVNVALAKSPNDQWLHYFKSKLLLGRGEVTKARECLLPVIRRQQRGSWVWTLLGSTYERDAPEKAITCYFRAVQLAGKPQEVANTRISLARLLAALERFDDATVQVRLALEYRTTGSFRIPQTLAQMAGSNWYSKLASQKDLPREPDVASEADMILFGAEQDQIEYHLGVVDNQNNDKGLAHVAFSPDDGAVLRYRRFRGIDAIAIGEIVEVGLSPGDQRPVRWRGSNITNIEGFVAEMTGSINQREGQSYGFMRTNSGERIFVPPTLMTGQPVDHEEEKRCIAVMGKDKKDKEGWRVLRWM